MPNSTSNNVTNSMNIDPINSISDGDLPWAIVLLPTTSAGHSGIGFNKHGLLAESWVYGVFMDGENAQQPLILGTLSGGPGQGSAIGNNENPSYIPSTDSGMLVPTTLNNSPSTSQNPAAASLPQSETGNTQFAFKFLLNRGYTAAQASGILGCLRAESGFNTNSYNPNDVGKPAYGLAQWRGSRLTGLKRFAGNKPIGDISVQMEYLVYELKHNKNASGSAEALLQNTANDVAASACAFANFERGAGFWSPLKARTSPVHDGSVKTDQGMRKRISYALGIYNSMKSQGTSS